MILRRTRRKRRMRWTRKRMNGNEDGGGSKSICPLGDGIDTERLTNQRWKLNRNGEFGALVTTKGRTEMGLKWDGVEAGNAPTSDVRRVW